MSTKKNSVQDWFKQQKEKRTLQDWVIDLGPFVMIFVLVIVFTSTTNRFFTYSNLVSNIGMNSAVLLLVALAGTFPILQQSIDLSVAAVVTIAGVVTATLAGQFGIPAAFIGIGVGLFAGTINGIIFAKLKVPSFLVTLGTLSVIEGFALMISGGTSIPFRNESVIWLSGGNIVPGVPNLIVFPLLIYAASIYIAFYTKFGRYTYALGENETVVELSGVNVDRYKILAFAFSGLLCGIAGALLAARISSGSPDMGDSTLLLQSIAAIVMGGTALTGGVGGPHRTILGVLVIAILSNGMNLLGIHPFRQEIILGVVVVAAVALSIDRRKIDVVK